MNNVTEISHNRTDNSSFKYLMLELQRIDYRLRFEVARLRSHESYWKEDDLRGLYISDQEIGSLLNNNSCFSKADISEGVVDTSFESINDAIGILDDEIELLRTDCNKKRIPLRIDKLCYIFGLSNLEKEALLLALLPEIDIKNERLFGYIQDDVTRKRPTVGLALDLLCPSFSGKVTARSIFSADAPLIKYNLISIFDDTPRKNATLLSMTLKSSERIYAYLLGSDEIDSTMLKATYKIKPEAKIEEMVLSEAITGQLDKVVNKYSEDNTNLVFYFCGIDGSGKLTLAEALCKQFNKNLLVTDMRLVLRMDCSLQNYMQMLLREAVLQESALYLDNLHVFYGDTTEIELAMLLGTLKDHKGLIFLAGNESWKSGLQWYNKDVIFIDFPRPDFNQRKVFWKLFLTDGSISESLIDKITNKFQLNGGQIRNAVNRARGLAIWRNGGVIIDDDLFEACRLESNQKLVQLARKIELRYIWDDIVLPEDQLDQLKSICDYVTYHYIVFEKWGFKNKLSLGKGLNILFAGPSGTGKTMAAEIIANELMIDLYKIDLAVIVSKYIGETEKNLNQIFKEAEDSNSILFFDEADALFGKRSEVRDSHDRYANIEIAYLLQKMEEYQGIVILATNLQNNLDEAFARRMHFSIEFPFPEENDRLQIWEKAFPVVAPLSDDIDLSFMARQFRITGGNIKNIVLSAAFQAASEGRKLSMNNLIKATKYEYQKLYKLCNETDFGKYYPLVRK